jgi:hypothetical protein
MPAGISFPPSRKTGTTTYGVDGTYGAASAGRQTALVEAGDDHSHSDGNLTTASAGSWSATDGQLNVCSTDHIAGSMRITAPDGSRQTVPLSRPAATGSASFTYSCSGDVLEIRRSFPGIADPMVIRYTRIGFGEDLPE